MNIIHVVPAISEEASGPTYTVVRLCQSLTLGGDKTVLVTLDWAPIANSPEWLRSFPLGFGPRRLGRSPAMARWLDTAARSGEIEVLHSHSLWMMPNIYPGFVARRHHLPLMVSPHGALSRWAMSNGSRVKRAFWPMLQKPALNSVSCFHATAESECADIRNAGFRQPVAVIPNGIDIPKRTEWVPRECRTLLFLGRIHPKKGLDMLLPAWRAVQNRHVHWQLRIAGRDEFGHLSEMKKLASELGLKRVEFAGPLYGQAKWDAYAEADLFVLPTHSENFGMTVAEALASGTPAIVTKGAPWAGLATNHAGWWVDTSVEALIAGLEEALDSPCEVLMQMGQRGRNWMARDYSWDEIGRRTSATYRWMKHGGAVPSWVDLLPS